MKLRHRYSIGIFLTGSICIAAMLTDRAISMQKLLGERAEARAEALASVAARAIIDPLQKGDDKAVKSQLTNFLELNGVERIRIINLGGKAIHSVGRRFGHSDEEALSRTGRELFEGPNGEPWTVEVLISTDGFKRAIVPLLVRGMLWGGVSLILLGITSWWLGNRVGRKIENLIKAVTQLHEDDRLNIPDVTDNSEIGALSRAFQEMHRRLKKENMHRMKLEEQREDMTNMLIHDLKHPLTVFRISLSVLNDIAASSQNHQQVTAVSLAARSSARLEAMVDGLLQTARLDHSGEPPKWERTSIVKFIENCAFEDEAIVTGYNRPWRLEVDPKLKGRWMFSHPELLRRLLGNLILNAVDHSPEGTPVTFGARCSAKNASNVEIFVSNDAANLQMKPDALHRGKYQNSSGNSHAGLGLAFCRMAAKLHSSHLVSEICPNGQVVFSVTIPMGPIVDPQAPNNNEEDLVHETT